jgi:hypothetical protein
MATSSHRSGTAAATTTSRYEIAMRTRQESRSTIALPAVLGVDFVLVSFDAAQHHDRCGAVREHLAVQAQ